MNAYRKGFIAGCFDVIHPGYVAMLKEAKYFCEYLVVAVHKDPSIERPNKQSPVLSLGDRVAIVEAIRYVDKVVTYATEKDLLELLVYFKPDVRFLGDDYKNNKITGAELEIPIHWIKRSEWSATKFKIMIAEAQP